MRKMKIFIGGFNQNRFRIKSKTFIDSVLGQMSYHTQFALKPSQ